MKVRRSGNHHELYWPRGIISKWLNGSAKGSDHSADAEDDDSNECDTEELCEWPKESRFKDNKGNEVKMDPNELCEWPKESRFKDNKGNEVKMDPNEALPRLRRQKSETFRAQYITAKEIKIRAGTWNVGGELPPEDLDIEDWLDISDPADIYVIGDQYQSACLYTRLFFVSYALTLHQVKKKPRRIIWLGDLNYRLNLSYDKTRQLISEKDWPKLAEYDQLTQELRKGRAFDGWSEGTLNFPPTYKYELNSEKYYGEDPKIGRRTPAWCDRILSFGMGMKNISYRRTEVRISDHRPVSALYVVEVEEFCPMRLQKALSYTDAEIEDGKVVMNMGLDG